MSKKERKKKSSQKSATQDEPASIGSLADITKVHFKFLPQSQN